LGLEAVHEEETDEGEKVISLGKKPRTKQHGEWLEAWRPVLKQYISLLLSPFFFLLKKGFFQVVFTESWPKLVPCNLNSVYCYWRN
jgi:hypothetical protein